MASDAVILVVEDDPDMRETVCAALQHEDYGVEQAADGKQMRDIMAQRHVDLVTLDLVLPGESGLDLARELRNTSDIPLIIITGRDNVIDKIVGLEIGADDYITKPFHVRELVARVGTVLRRTRANNGNAKPVSHGEEASKIKFGNWQLDLFGQRLSNSSGEAVILTTYEFQVLSALAQRAGKAVSRDQIMDLTADREWNPFDRSVDVLIGKLRKKLGDDSRDP